MKLKIIASAASLLLLSACSGNHASYEKQSHVSLGQELVDLQEAKNKGVVTSEEYADLRKKIMENHTSELPMEYKGAK